MNHVRGRLGAVAIAVVGAGLIAPTAAAAPSTALQIPGLRLAANDTALPLGGGTAFIIGGSGLATPGPSYVDAAMSLYLEPLGFTGTTQVVTTPEQLYPFLGPFGGTLDESVAQGQQNLYDAIMAQYQNGDLSAENPAVVFGWSQGAVIESLLQYQLASAGVPSDYVHFVMIGNVSSPNGGMLERFNLPDNAQPTLPSLGLTFSGAAPSDLYPAEVYNREYDGFADFPQYPINFLSVLNAIFGIAFQHTTYLGLTPDQISDAILLPNASPDSLTNYYMIPTEGLPLLYPLLFFGSGGQALYDLFEPVTRILVNLGYGNIEHGWSQGPADVPTPLGFLPDSATLAALMQELPQALSNAWQQGVSDFFDEVFHPTNTPPGFMAEMEGFINAISDTGMADFGSTFPTLDDLFGTFPPHTGIPFLDVGTALLFNLPQINYDIFAAELADGDLLNAIGLPLAVDLGILPLAVLGALI
ncbi:MAG: PE-PPE domain-containing protein [Mycobacterium sp.]